MMQFRFETGRDAKEAIMPINVTEAKAVPKSVTSLAESGMRLREPAQQLDMSEAATALMDQSVRTGNDNQTGNAPDLRDGLCKGLLACVVWGIVDSIIFYRLNYENTAWPPSWQNTGPQGPNCLGWFVPACIVLAVSEFGTCCLHWRWNNIMSTNPLDTARGAFLIKSWNDVPSNVQDIVKELVNQVNARRPNKITDEGLWSRLAQERFKAEDSQLLERLLNAIDNAPYTQEKKLYANALYANALWCSCSGAYLSAIPIVVGLYSEWHYAGMPYWIGIMAIWCGCGAKALNNAYNKLNLPN